MRVKDKMQDKEIENKNLQGTSGSGYMEYGFCLLCNRKAGIGTFLDKDGNLKSCCESCAKQRGYIRFDDI